MTVVISVEMQRNRLWCSCAGVVPVVRVPQQQSLAARAAV